MSKKKKLNSSSLEENTYKYGLDKINIVGQLCRFLGKSQKIGK